MQTLRITATLDKSEVQELSAIADREGRTLREMVRCIIRQDLIRRGLLTNSDSQDTQTTSQEAANATAAQ